MSERDYHFTEERKELHVREQRLVYLITYSRADFNKIASREAFAKAVIQGFTTTTAAGVVHWVILRKMHANSSDSNNANDFHYHMALKLDKRATWLSVRNHIEEYHDILVNFSANHNTYYSAYKYGTKEDRECVRSDNHPDLEETPLKTEKGYRREEKESKSSK